MKKSIVLLILTVIIALVLQGATNVSSKEGNELPIKELSYDEIADKLVRFHVIANSDTVEDQTLKLKVRDKIIDYLKVELNNCTTLDEAKSVLVAKIDDVNRIAREVIVDNNYDYKVKTMLSKEEFPDKIYGDYLFPQGVYSAYRVIIGEGKGKNWWCVMFPPLCFVDESKNTVNANKMDEEMDKVLDSDSGKNIETPSKESGDKSTEDNTQKEEKPVLKFKLWEIITNLFK